MSHRDESFGDRLRKISLLHWGLICIGASGVSGFAMSALHPAANRAEAAGRAAGQLLFVVVGLVLIVLHFTKRKKGGRETAARQAAGKNKPGSSGVERPAGPPPRVRRKGS